jgi:2-dehydro-3-deoxyphosphogluconate aldolase/(4S)-4-hydroxy-2-oxoglutarate aldolase
MKYASDDLKARLRAVRVLPVVTVSGAGDGVALARALLEGGLPAIEVTLRVEGAMEAIRAIADACPDMLIGAGTVRSGEQAQAAIVSGASFLVSPGLVPEVAGFARRGRVAYMPGVATPTEMEMARNEGISFLKLFPAEVAGGRGMLTAVNAAMPDFAFVPTGGVTLDSMEAYLSIPNVVAVGGSWLAPAQAVAEKNWGFVAENAKAAAARARAVA